VLGRRLWDRLLLRLFFLAIPLVNLICLIELASDPNHRSWYDRIAGTVVVKV
jgi:uncharacterized RDD family membrane protein YckC